MPEYTDNPDTVMLTLPAPMAMQGNLMGGLDTVAVSGPAGPTQVRLTFTSAEVGNGNAMDAGTMTNQDAGLAVRVQLEGAGDALTGPVSRFDDEGIRFDAQTPGLTFDVRDLVAGVSRGNMFSVAELGTMGGDTIRYLSETRNVYVNAGMGDDTVGGGQGNDFLVGGAGSDQLTGGAGNDSFIGGGGNDMIFGGGGDDVVIYAPATDGADMISLGNGRDTVNVGGTAQVRLTFTSAEVGNNTEVDAGTLANQDGGLAVRMQAEDAGGALTGTIARVEDEGVRFVATAGATFDVRDLVSGAARGDMFRIAELGTAARNRLDYAAETASVYANAGGGNDQVSGGSAGDFLVGGAGYDVLAGRGGNDSLIGGGGNDSFVFLTAGDGNDTIIDFVVGQDKINLRALDLAFADLMIATAAGVTTVGVDTDADMMADMTVTLTNGAALTESDFIF